MRRTAIFFSAGLGNALLAQPLLKRLKARGDHLTGIFTTDWGAYEAYELSTYLDEQVKLLSRKEIVSFGLKHPKRFRESYLDYFAATRKFLLLANLISQRIHTNRLPYNLPAFLRPMVHFHPPLELTHDGAQYLALLDRTVKEADLSEADFHLPLRDEKLIGLQGTESGSTIPVQVTGGNNRAPHKSWTSSSWIGFFRKMENALPDHRFLLLGDQFETETAHEIAYQCPNTKSVVGETELWDVAKIMLQAPLYIGIDSGLMHLAVALGKPTFCVWGGSDHRLFGYQKINAKRHFIAQRTLDCWPCNSYLSPNTSRVVDPLRCPDFKCIRGLEPENVAQDFLQFFNRL